MRGPGQHHVPIAYLPDEQIRRQSGRRARPRRPQLPDQRGPVSAHPGNSTCHAGAACRPFSGLPLLQRSQSCEGHRQPWHPLPSLAGMLRQQARARRAWCGRLAPRHPAPRWRRSRPGRRLPSPEDPRVVSLGAEWRLGGRRQHRALRTFLRRHVARSGRVRVAWRVDHSRGYDGNAARTARAPRSRLMPRSPSPTA